MSNWFNLGSKQTEGMCLPCPRRSGTSTPSFALLNNNENPDRRLSSPFNSSTPPGSSLTMGLNANGSQLSTQHERLILELLPLKDPAAFHAWLAGDFVRGSWDEFRRDGLYPLAAPSGSSRASLEPDKHKTAQAARDAIHSRKPKFLVYHPDKRNWTLEDHHVRFIVTVIADNMLQGLWSESDWKKKSVDIAKAVYEVLAFLKAIDVVDKEPPRYTD